MLPRCDNEGTAPTGVRLSVTIIMLTYFRAIDQVVAGPIVIYISQSSQFFYFSEHSTGIAYSAITSAWRGRRRRTRTRWWRRRALYKRDNVNYTSQSS